jgi:hypothetical protein
VRAVTFGGDSRSGTSSRRKIAALTRNLPAATKADLYENVSVMRLLTKFRLSGEYGTR